MAFLTSIERYFGLLLIVDLMMKMGYITNYSHFFILVFTPLVGFGLYYGQIRLNSALKLVLVGYAIYIINFIIIYLSGDNYIMSWVTAIIGSMVAVITVQLGGVNYVQPDGPYGVGHRVVVTEDGTRPTVSVFYPIDREDEKKNSLNPAKISSFIIEGDNDITGFMKIAQKVPRCFFEPYKAYTLKAINDEKLHTVDIDFREGGKKLTPVVVSHGMTGNRVAHASIISYLVSYGCIVYAPTHTDQSANYYKDNTKNPPEDVFFHMYDKEKDGPKRIDFNLKQLNRRMEDVKSIVDLIISESKTTVPSIDISKLTALGHSMGGISAIEMCNKFKDDFKLCIALDPFYSPRVDSIKEEGKYTINQPLLILSSENFHTSKLIDEYDGKEVHTKFVQSIKKNNTNKVYDVYMKNCLHANMCDFCLLIPHVLLMIGAVSKSVDVRDKLKECSDIVLAFLEETDFVPIKCGRLVKSIPEIEIM